MALSSTNGGMSIDQVVTGLANYMADLDREDMYYRLGHQSAEARKLRETSIHTRYSRFIGEDAVSALSETRPDNERLAQQGMYLLSNIRITEATMSIDETWRKIQDDSKADIKFPDTVRNVPYEMVYEELHKTDDPTAVTQLLALWRETHLKLEDARMDYIDAVNEVSTGLGFDDFNGVIENVMGIDIAKFREQISEFMEGTGDAYRASMKKISDDHFEGEELTYARFVFHLGNNITSTSLTPRMSALDTAKQIVSGLGIDAKLFDQFIIDDAQRENKKTRGFMTACDHPNILISTGVHSRDTTDYDAYRTQLHEYGHSVHHAMIDSSQNLAYIVEGDKATAETFAYLFEHLFMNKTFLRQFMEGTEEEFDATVEDVKTSKLYMVRRYMAKSVFETKMYSGNMGRVDENLRDTDGVYDSMAGMYEDIMNKGQVVTVEKERWTVDIDPFFYGANYALAYPLESQLVAQLEGKFGEEWYANPEAGELIKPLWAPGTELTAMMLAEAIEPGKGLTTEYLKDRVMPD